MVEPDSAEPIWKTRAACRGVAAWPVSWSSATLAARAGSIERAPVLAPGAAAERRCVGAAGVGAAFGDAGFDPAFRVDQRVGAEPLKPRWGWPRD